MPVRKGTVSRRKIDYTLTAGASVAIVMTGVLFAARWWSKGVTAAFPAAGSLLAIALFLLLGLGLPRWIGFGIRLERAAQRKAEERDKWGFHGRDREGPWINYVDRPVVRQDAIARGTFFYSEWLIIHDGLIIVNPGVSEVRQEGSGRKVTYDLAVRRTYAWDGCTPKRFFYWIAVVGTPDWWHAPQTIRTIETAGGAPHLATFEAIWQIAHHASLVHDALYQYLDHHPIPKKDVDALFHAMLLEAGVPRFVSAVYHWAVRTWGPAHEAGIEPAAGAVTLNGELRF